MKATLAKLAVTITAVVGVVAGVSTGTASAFSETNSRCPGTVQVPTMNGYNFGSPSIEFPQRFAWRSSCYSNYTQVISVRYRLFGYVRGTGWMLRSSTTRTATVNPGHSGAWIAGWSGLSPNADVSADVRIEWRLTNGYLVGSTYLDYNSVGDYRCITVACGVFSDPTVGAYMHFVTGY